MKDQTMSKSKQTRQIEARLTALEAAVAALQTRPRAQATVVDLTPTPAPSVDDVAPPADAGTGTTIRATKVEIMEALARKGVEYPQSATKAELLDLLGAAS